jgi:hypothetical protein
VLAQVILGRLNLRGFAGPVAAFERDETNHQLKQ